jgi:hypothetical protein
MQKRRLSLAPAPAKQTYAPAPYTGSGTEVVDHLTASRAATLGIPASRLRAIAEWHGNRRGRRHVVIRERLRQIAIELAATNDNAPQRAAA